MKDDIIIGLMTGLFLGLVAWCIVEVADNKKEEPQGWSYIEDELPSKY